MKDTEFLFKRDSSDKIRCWTAYVDSTNNVTTLSGIYKGELVENTRIIEPKNVGKANETTKKEQAQKEVEAMIAKKMKQGYISLADDVKAIETAGIGSLGMKYAYKATDGNTYKNASIPIMAFRELLPIKSTKTHNDGKIKPMLAHKWRDVRDKFKDESVFIQPKYNGFRCIAEVKDENVTLYSRKGEEFTELVEIKRQIRFLCIANGIRDIVFDGEIYNHDMALQEISSATRKRNMHTPLLQYHIYDVVNDDIQSKRLATIHNAFATAGSFDNIMPAWYEKVSITKCKEKRAYMIANGYEGLIIRPVDGKYEQKRSKYLLKYKQRLYGDFTVVRIEESSRRKGYPIFVLANDRNKHTFKASYDGTTEERQAIFDDKDKYKGLAVTCQYFERTEPPKEVPFHARVVRTQFTEDSDKF